MRKAVRKMALLLTLCCVVAVWGIQLPKAYAVSPEEIREIQTNTVVADCLEKNDTVKYYKFTMDKTGYFQLAFQIPGLDVDPAQGWKISLLDTDGNTCLYETSITQNTVFPAFPFVKGKMFYIKIRSVSTYFPPEGIGYEISLNTYEDTSWEVEFNNTAAEANSVTANQNYRGNLISADDVDYYTFETKEDGFFQVEFLIPGIDINVEQGWKVTIFQDQKEIHSYIMTENTRTCPYPFAKGTKFMVKIQAQSTYFSPTFVEYNFSVLTKESKYWEQENNDQIVGANEIKSGKTYEGTALTPGDTDYYKIKMSKKGFLTYTFRPNTLPEEIGQGYHLYVYNQDNEELYNLSSVTGETSATLYLNKGVYYIRVSVQNSYFPPANNVAYSLTATTKAAAKPGKVTIQSLKSSTYKYWSSTYKNIKYKVKAIANASGYEYQYCTNKKFKKDMVKGTVEGKTGTFGEKLVSKKNYYVRIRAYYETPTGERTYGAWSSVKAVKIK